MDNCATTTSNINNSGVTMVLQSLVCIKSFHIHINRNRTVTHLQHRYQQMIFQNDYRKTQN